MTTEEPGRLLRIARRWPVPRWALTLPLKEAAEPALEELPTGGQLGVELDDGERAWSVWPDTGASWAEPGHGEVGQ